MKFKVDDFVLINTPAIPEIHKCFGIVQQESHTHFLLVKPIWTPFESCWNLYPEELVLIPNSATSDQIEALKRLL